MTQDELFTKLSQQISNLDEKVDRRISHLEDRFDKQEESISKLDARLDKQADVIAKLDGRINSLDARLVKQEATTSRLDVGFTKLYKYIVQNFADINKKLDSKADKEQVDRVYNLVDTMINNQQTDQQERLMAYSQLSRSTPSLC